jgi:uncharacterized protein GlcG (DUF336 family)
MRTKPALTSADAHKIMAACKEEAAKNGWAVCIAVVDDGGGLMLFERCDGSSAMSALSAVGKAQTSAMLRVTSGMLGGLFTSLPGTLKLPGMPVPGGVPVMYQGECVGGVGVSGVEAPDDERVAIIGAAAIAP